MKKVWFLGHLQGKLKKLLKFRRKKSNNWLMVSFIHNGSEITTSMRYNFKTKSAKSYATLLRKTYFLNFKLQIIRLPQRHWRCKPTHMKNIFSSSFYQMVFLCQFVGMQVMGLVPKNLLPACWRYKRGFFFFSYIR